MVRNGLNSKRILSVCLHKLSTLAKWRPLPDLREIGLTHCDILPVFPRQLDFLCVLKTSLTKKFLRRELQLPRNFKVWRCQVDVEEFRVPLSVCTHQSLHTWRQNGGCHVLFPLDIQGSLVLHTLDFLGQSCQNCSKSILHLGQIARKRFSDSMRILRKPLVGFLSLTQET